MTTGYAPAPESPTSDAPPPLDDIRALVDERGRYEGWLQALDARRGATPAHVLERVQRDYAGRLERVGAQIAEHAAPLRAHEDALARRHEQIEHRLNEERDALAEVELRTLVGEYAADEGEQRRAGAQEVIGGLERNLGSASAQLADVRALSSRVGQSASTPAAVPNAASADQPAGGAPAQSEVAAPAAGASATESSATPPAAGDQASGFVGAGFDHGAVDAARAALGDRDTSPTPTFNDAFRAGNGGLVGGNARPQPVGEAGQEKTLRCQDCGALNYPTEWYCERCGGELAAM